MEAMKKGEVGLGLFMVLRGRSVKKSNIWSLAKTVNGLSELDEVSLPDVFYLKGASM
jgi:hypothetical protein